MTGSAPLRVPRTEREVAADVLYALFVARILEPTGPVVARCCEVLGLSPGDLGDASVRAGRGYDVRPSRLSVVPSGPQAGDSGDNSVENRTARCRRCGQVKPLDAFRRPGKRDPSKWCRQCSDAASRRASRTYRLGATRAVELRLDLGSPLLGLDCSACSGELLAGDLVVLTGRVEVRHATCA